MEIPNFTSLCRVFQLAPFVQLDLLQSWVMLANYIQGAIFLEIQNLGINVS